MPQVWYRFVAHSWEIYFLFVDMLSRFEVTIDGSLRNVTFPHQIFYGWRKIFLKVGFKAWPHTKLVCKFRGDPLRDGWDPLRRNLGLNQ